MTQDNITYLTDACLITCVVSADKGDDILKAARNLGVSAGIVFQGRGTGLRERLGLLGIAVEAKKEVVVMMAPNDSRDILIHGLFNAGDMGTPGAGFIYVTPIDRAALYVPENIIDQLNASDSA